MCFRAYRPACRLQPDQKWDVLVENLRDQDTQITNYLLSVCIFLFYYKIKNNTITLKEHEAKCVCVRTVVSCTLCGHFLLLPETCSWAAFFALIISTSSCEGQIITSYYKSNYYSMTGSWTESRFKQFKAPTLYLFIQSFLVRPGTVAAILSHLSGVFTG